MRTILRLALTGAALLALAGCSSGGGTPGDGGPGSGDVAAPCLVGTWNLDVADYEAQSLAYLTETGIPLVSYEMGGVGTVEFTAAGEISTDIDIVVDYVVDAAGTQYARQTLSVYTGSGEWEVGDDAGTIDISDYQTVESGALNPVDSGLPPVSFFDIPSLTTDCTTDGLTLQGPVAPISSHWYR